MSDMIVKKSEDTITILIDIDNDDSDFYSSFYLDCPFITDLNTCAIIPKSETNFCPCSVEDDDGITTKSISPPTCPLRTHKVIVEKR